MALLLVLLVDELFLEGLALVHLFLQPGLFLDNKLLLALLKVLLVLNLLLPSELLAQGMSLRVLPLLYKSFKDLLVLEELSGLLEAEGLVQLALVVLAQLDQLSHVRLLQRFQVSLAGIYELLLVFVPVAFEVAQVLLLLLQQLVHFNVVLG